MKTPYLILLIFLLAACHKSSTPPGSARKNKDIALFSVGTVCFTQAGMVVDSTLQFNNQSYLQDTLNLAQLPVLSYEWDFGDHSTSSEISPTHSYSLPGSYTATLITYIDNQPSDTLSKTVQIVMGLREFKIDNYNYAIDMDEAAEKGALVLYASSSSSGGTRTFGLLRVDSLLRVRWTKPLADENTIRLNSIKRINDNAYILSGNYMSGDISSFYLSEIDSLGNLIWMNEYSNLSGTNYYTLPVSDGGFLTNGSVLVSNADYAAIVKCDANGNELWRKVFDNTPSLVGINNIVELTGGGYTFAAENGAIPYPINLVLTQLDVNGNITNQKSFAPNYPVSSGNAGLLYNSNAYIVYCTDPGSENYNYLFDNTFSTTGSPSFSEGVIRGGFNDGANFVVYTFNNQYSELNQLLPNGITGWNYTIDPTINLSCTSSLSGVGRACREAIYTTGNEIMVLADGQNISNTQSLYIVKLTPEGNVK
jgi:PKD repeat protein